MPSVSSGFAFWVIHLFSVGAATPRRGPTVVWCGHAKARHYCRLVAATPRRGTTVGWCGHAKARPYNGR